MSFTRRTVQISDDSSGTGAATQATPAYNQLSSDFIGVRVKWEATNGVATVDDTALNTYIPLSKAADTTNNEFVQLFYCLNSIANAANVVTMHVPGTATFRSIVVLPYSHTGTASFVAEATPLAAQGPGTAVATGSFTAGDLAILGVADFTGTTTTAGTNWTEQQDTAANGSHTFDRIDSPGGTITGTCTLAVSATWDAVAASFKDTPIVGGTQRLTLLGAG